MKRILKDLLGWAILIGGFILFLALMAGLIYWDKVRFVRCLP